MIKPTNAVCETGKLAFQKSRAWARSRNKVLRIVYLYRGQEFNQAGIIRQPLSASGYRVSICCWMVRV